MYTRCAAVGLPEIELCQIAVKALLTAMLIHADHDALEDAVRDDVNNPARTLARSEDDMSAPSIA